MTWTVTDPVSPIRHKDGKDPWTSAHSFSLMADNSSRIKRAVTRSLFPSDKGPIEFLDATGNLIQLERELEKPRKYNEVLFHHDDMKKENR